MTMYAAVNSTLTFFLKHIISIISMVSSVSSRESSIPDARHDKVAITWVTAKRCIMQPVFSVFIW